MVSFSSMKWTIASISGFGVAQPLERHRHGAVDDLHQAAADELLVLDQRDVRLDAGGVAVHHEADGAGGREHRGLGVAIAEVLAQLERLVPRLLGRGVEIGGHEPGVDLRHRVAVLAHHAQERVAVLLVAGERAAVVAGDARRLRVGLAGHHRGDGGGVGAPLVAVVRQAARHQQRAQVGVAQAQRPVVVAVPLDRLRRIARVRDDDLLRRDQRAARGLERGHVELAALGHELHQVDRRQVARRVVEEHVLGARVAGVDPRRGRRRCASR